MANLQFTTIYCKVRNLAEANYSEEYHRDTNIQNIYKHSLLQNGLCHVNQGTDPPEELDI